MERAGRDGTPCQTLTRIAGTLLSLAVLAERLYGKPEALRSLVLWILRPAEAIARDFVLAHDVCEHALPAMVVSGSGGDSAADALRLAHRFRALAAALTAIAAWSEAGTLSLPLPGCDRLAGFTALKTFSDRVSAPPAALAFGVPQHIDTS